MAKTNTQINILLKDLKENKEQGELTPINNKVIREKRTQLQSVFAKKNKNEDITILIVPSLSLAAEELKDIVGILYYEFRALWEIMLAEEENIKIVFVSSLPVLEEAISHLLENIEGKKNNIRKKISFLNLKDEDTTTPLVTKMLKREDLILELKSILPPTKTYLQSFISSDLEFKLAKELEIPVFGTHPKLSYYSTKSGNKHILKESGILYSDGINDIKSYQQLELSFIQLWKKHPSDKKFMIKLDNGVSGNGNAVIDIPVSYDTYLRKNNDEKKSIINIIFNSIKFQSNSISWEDFTQRLKKGGIIETFIDGKIHSSPSGQAVIYPCGKIEFVSTHEQILDEQGMSFLGSVFPADNRYRKEIQSSVLKVAEVLKRRGILGAFAVDFLIASKNKETSIWAIEINIRRGGTTHPYYIAKHSTKATFCPHRSILINPKGQEVHYISNDNVILEKLTQTTPKIFLNFMKKQELLFNKKKQKGAVFHMLEAMIPFGKIGYTAIANSKEDANAIHQLVLQSIQTFINRI